MLASMASDVHNRQFKRLIRCHKAAFEQGCFFLPATLRALLSYKLELAGVDGRRQISLIRENQASGQFSRTDCYLCRKSEKCIEQ
jgi:hypothetical protein